MRSFKQHLNEELTTAQGQEIRRLIKGTKKDAVRAYAVACFNFLIQPGNGVADIKEVPLPAGLTSRDAEYVRKWFKTVIRPRTDWDWLPGMEPAAKFLQGFGATLDRTPIKEERLTEAFTKQHYIAIAELIDDTLASVEESTNGNDKALDAVEQLAQRLATMFKNDNPNFDKFRFLQACGIR